MILTVPVLNGHDLTKKFIKNLNETVEDKEHFTLIIVDNASHPPLELSEFLGIELKIGVVRKEKNYGYYYPLKLTSEEFLWTNNPAYEDRLVGLAHNDLEFHEHGWDVRLREEFSKHDDIGLIGLAGSKELYVDGGISRTLCNFHKFASQGDKVEGFQKVAFVDSLFMVFRRDVTTLLNIEEDITPAHYNDRIWSLRLWEKGYSVGVLGIKADHGGGGTLARQDFAEAAKQWCLEYGVDPIDKDNYLEAVYRLGLQRYLKEFQEDKKMLPFIVKE